MSIERRCPSAKCGVAEMSAPRVGNVASRARSDLKASKGSFCGVGRSDAGAGA